jgi:acetyl esterase/lipase
MKLAIGLAIAGALISGIPIPDASVAQTAPSFGVPTPVEAPPGRGEIPLLPGLRSGASSTEHWARFGPYLVVRNVTYPTITPVLPDPKTATGAAVVVAPGGGFMLLAMDEEGWPVARWLADHGVAAFVLKYRTNPSPPDNAQAFAQFGALIAKAASDPTAQHALIAPHAVEDALSALSFVRTHAKQYGVDPHRVGMIGFSAGAMTTIEAALSPAPEGRPDFIGYIYGPMRAVAVPTDAPPMFTALANDDPLMGGQGFGVVDAWIKAKRPVELHAYQSGGHGFGVGRPGTTTTEVMPEFLAWMQARGLSTRTSP